MAEITLRNYQARAIHELFATWKAGYRSVVMVAPTGCGKRILALWLMDYGHKRRRKVLFVGNRRLLITQAQADADKFGIDYGIIMANAESGNAGSGNQIASVHTLKSWYFTGKYSSEITGEGLPDADLVVIDEAHQEPKKYRQLLKLYPDAKFLCLTATPVGPEGRSLVPGLYDTLIEPVKNSELINDGFLLPTTVFAPSEPNIAGVTIDGGKEYSQKALGKAVQSCTVFADVFKEWEAYQDQATVCFVPGIAFGRHIVDEYNLRMGSAFPCGKAAYLIEAKTPQEERDEILKRVEGEGRGVIVSCDILREGFDCLDAHTQVLTTRGWVGEASITGGDRVWSLNKQSGAAELVSIDRIVRRSLKPGERMLEIKSQHVNIRVTEGHEFHIKYSDPSTKKPSARWLTKKAASIFARKSEYHLPISAEADFPGLPLSDDEIKFIAWFMTDGGFSRNAIEIVQSPDKFHEDIRGILNRLGLHYGEYRKTPRTGFKPTVDFYYRFSIPQGARRPILGMGWLRYAQYLDKNVSPLLHKMTREQFKVFWDEMMKGDGSVDSTNQLICSRQCQADAYMQMAVTRGYAAICRKDVTKHGTPVYYVGIRDKKFICSRPSDFRSARMTLEAPSEPENVWCVTNRNGTLFTRRNGKVAILGNCPVLSVAVDLQPNSQLRTYWQKIGRIKRPFDGQRNATYLDFAGNCWKFPHPDEDPEWPTGEFTTQDVIERRRVDKEEPKPIVCLKCGMMRKAGPVCPNCGHGGADSVRKVRMGDGSLVEIPFETKKRQEISEAQRAYNAWKGCLYGALAKGWTYAQCSRIYKAKTGQWPPSDWPGVYHNTSLDARRRPRDEFSKGELYQWLGEKSPV